MSPRSFTFVRNNRSYTIKIDARTRLNVAKFCSVFNRSTYEWKRKPENQALITKCWKKHGLTLKDVVHIENTGPQEDLGTYMHMDLSRVLAHWCDEKIGEKLDAWNEKYVGNTDEEDENEDENENNDDEDGGEEVENELNVEDEKEENENNDEKEYKDAIDNSNFTSSQLVFGKYTITCRGSDGNVNFTEMASAFGKTIRDWTRTQQSKDYLSALASSLNVCLSKILAYEDYGPKNRATWGHPMASVEFARWCSLELGVMMNKWVYELATTGKVELGKEKSIGEIDQHWQSQISQLKSQLDESRQQLQNRPTLLIFEPSHEDREQIIIDQMIKDFYHNHNLNMYDYTEVVYVAYIGMYDGKHVFKFGKSKDMKERIKDHRTTFNKFNLIFILACDMTYVEKNFKTFTEDKKQDMKLAIKGANQTELFFTTKDVILEDFIEEIKRLAVKNNFVDHKTLTYQFKELKALQASKDEISDLKIKEVKLQSEINEAKLRAEIKEANFRAERAAFEAEKATFRMCKGNMNLRHKLEILTLKTASSKT